MNNSLPIIPAAHQDIDPSVRVKAEERLQGTIQPNARNPEGRLQYENTGTPVVSPERLAAEETMRQHRRDKISSRSVSIHITQFLERNIHHVAIFERALADAEAAEVSRRAG